MKKALTLLICLILTIGAAFAIDLYIDPDSGVQENGFFGLYLQSKDAKTILYISVTPQPGINTVTAAHLLVDEKPYLPDNLLWYRVDGDFYAPAIFTNQNSGFSTYAEFYDLREDGIELYFGYVEDQLQCFGGPDDLIWSLLMDGNLNLTIYDEWGYYMGELSFTVIGDTKPLLSTFSDFIQNNFKPSFS